MKKHILIGVLFLVLCISGLVYVVVRKHTNTDTNSPDSTYMLRERNERSSRAIVKTGNILLPLSGSTPTEEVPYSIALEEIHQGCQRQDCIPSVDNPQFISVKKADKILTNDSIGISLSLNGEDRFYPFLMLVTREIVNDRVGDIPILVTYCPLCGTGIVFERTVDGKIYEFGVSGMLWQSNLLMYNRSENIEERNLWSQVLGEAVVGHKTGAVLQIIPSNIQKYGTWKSIHTKGSVLSSGNLFDPYEGEYYSVAKRFNPKFNETESPLYPTEYVLGVAFGNEFRAYVKKDLPVGEFIDDYNGTTLVIEKEEDDTVTVRSQNGIKVPFVEGFWFSWKAAHPETSLWMG